MTTPPIKRLLIANRGEIARRIARTARRLGIESVAVFTPPDAGMPFVLEATTTVALLEPNDYLSIDAIVGAVKLSGADAVHPGYGFLSENPEFAEKLQALGVRFIGPTPAAMRALGDKTNAKAAAAKASVPMAPTQLLGAGSIDDDVQLLTQFGGSVGFPVLIKAAAGGGGRGMRLVDATSDFRGEIESARRESARAFGSEVVFAEKLISPARHIEVQIAGDATGHAVALGTRDCTLQRSNQKIIEEAPAPNLPESTVTALYGAATRLAQETGYSNLGTVEFLLSPDGTFSFLEVNSRLQVEHPVTEMTTGLDLVELQIRIAEGNALFDLGLHTPPPPNGHAIECRLCAETFVSGSPVISTGVIFDFTHPAPEPGTLRFDLGLEAGNSVSHYYDSMIGKVIVHATSRAEAVDLSLRAISESSISGVRTNRSVLTKLLTAPQFKAVSHTIQGTRDLLPSAEQLKEAERQAAAVFAAVSFVRPQSKWAGASVWSELPGWSLSGTETPRTWRGMVNDQEVETVTRSIGNGTLRVRLTGSDDGSPREFQLSVRRVGDKLVIVPEGSGEFPVRVLRNGEKEWLHAPYGSFVIATERGDAHTAASEVSGDGVVVRSPLPGKIAAVSVSVGQHVQSGDTLLVLDSMKMEHPVRAPLTAVVKALSISPGEVVQAGALLVTLSSAE